MTGTQVRYTHDMRCFMALLPWDMHRRYQFLLLPPANTLTDRLRLLLPLNAVVLKDVQADAYQELYSGHMRPWREFVPVNAKNVSATVQMLRANTPVSWATPSLSGWTSPGARRVLC